MIKAQDVVQRAERARQLLNDPLLVEVLNLIESDLLSQWENCPARDVEGREAIWVYYKTAKKFRGILEGAVESGKIAALREKSLKDKALTMFRTAS